MIVTYTPADGEKREWAFKPNKLMAVEAEAIESRTGWTYQEFGVQFMKGSTLARHALLWVLLKRETPGIKYSDVTFAVDEIDFDLDADERAATIAVLQTKTDLDDDERTALEQLVKATEDADPKVEG